MKYITEIIQKYSELFYSYNICNDKHCFLFSYLNSYRNKNAVADSQKLF